VQETIHNYRDLQFHQEAANIKQVSIRPWEMRSQERAQVRVAVSEA